MTIGGGSPKVKFTREDTESKMKKGQTLNLKQMERDVSASISPEKDKLQILPKKEKLAKNAGGQADAEID